MANPSIHINSYFQTWLSDAMGEMWI